MMYMFARLDNINVLDLSSFNLDKVTTDKMLNMFKKNISADSSGNITELDPSIYAKEFLVVSKDAKLKNYNYLADHCIPVGPSLDANGGKFENGEDVCSDFKTNVVESLDEAGIDQVISDALLAVTEPMKDGYTFISWEEQQQTRANTSIFDKLNVVYYAKWHKGDKVTTDNGTVIKPGPNSGTPVVDANGAVTVPEGGIVILPDGTEITPEAGSIVNPDGTITPPASTETPGGSTETPDEEIEIPDEETETPGGNPGTPGGNTGNPGGNTGTPGGNPGNPGGSNGNPDGDIEHLGSSNVNQGGSSKPQSGSNGSQSGTINQGGTVEEPEVNNNQIGVIEEPEVNGTTDGTLGESQVYYNLESKDELNSSVIQNGDHEASKTEASSVFSVFKYSWLWLLILLVIIILIIAKRKIQEEEEI